MKRLNKWLAANLSKWFSTMTFFYFCLLLTVLPLFWPSSLSAVQFISSGVLQLVALPLLAVSAVIIGEKAEARAQQDHEALMELIADLHEKHDALHLKLNGDTP